MLLGVNGARYLALGACYYRCLARPFIWVPTSCTATKFHFVSDCQSSSYVRTPILSRPQQSNADAAM
eukprot:scaffold376857_cov15-Prasinocladus_malaysianus.AAC.1